MVDSLVWVLLLPLRGLWSLVKFDPLLAAFAIFGVFFLFTLFGNPKALAAWRESSERERLRKGKPKMKGLRQTVQEAWRESEIKAERGAQAWLRTPAPPPHTRLVRFKSKPKTEGKS